MNPENAQQLTSPTRKWIEIVERPHIKGPGQMMKNLADQFPDLASEDLLTVWLSREDLAIGIEQFSPSSTVEEIDWSIPFLAPTEECQKMVVICRAEDESNARNLAKKFDFEKHNPLDALLVTREKWWSYFCKNQECCPKDGRPLNTVNLELDAIEQRHQIWLTWLNLLNQVSTQMNNNDFKFEDEQSMRNSLDDLAIRDCVLNHLSINPDSHNAWIRIFDKFLESKLNYNNHVFNCLYAAIFFGVGDLKKADEFTKNALLLEPEYSLALLMQHGLEIKMDSRKIVSAFTHFTSEELLRNTPVRI
ncbi:MAG: hypothetical protein RL228_1028 [Actinomycetota bacterium]|jgi:hypothetical protein